MKFVKATLHGQEEAEGLKALAAAGKIRIVQVIAFDDRSITLEKIENHSPGEKFWQRFGRELAELHEIQQSHFGFEFDNHIGATPQPNPKIPINKISWTEYFIEHRLNHMLKNPRLSSHQELQQNFVRAEPAIRQQLEKVSEAPSLVHGDLWNGNFLCTDGQVPVLIDPAPYWGHREVDLAMSELFGGFDAAFYQAYDQRLPLLGGYEQRKHIYNLYHLLNHWILFGASYSGQVLSILERFSKIK